MTKQPVLKNVEQICKVNIFTYHALIMGKAGSRKESVSRTTLTYVGPIVSCYVHVLPL